MKKGLLYAILASVLWAIVNPFIKQGLSYDFTPMNFAGIRFTLAGILTLLIGSIASRKILCRGKGSLNPIAALSMVQTVI